MSALSGPHAALQAELLHLRTVINNVGAYIYTKDTAGCYTYVNELVAQLFGRPLDQIIGHRDEEFFDLAISDELRRHDRRVLDHGETLTREERNIVKPSGELRIYWTVKAPVRDAAGTIVGMCGISTDITERKRLEGELERQRQLLDTVLSNIDACVYMKDRDHRYLYVNNRTAEQYGRPIEGIVGRLEGEVLPPEQARLFWDLDEQVFASGKRQSGEETLVAPDGQTRHFWSIKVPLQQEGQPDALIGFSSDITELHLLKEELRRQANTDQLTGISNRRHFLEAAGTELARSRRYGHALSVLLFDLDHFKEINDRHGHQAGDRVLMESARHSQALIRDSDLIGRMGGEEFAVLLPETGHGDAAALAQRLCAALRGLQLRGDWNGTITATASVGVAQLQATDSTIESLLARADRAMYLAKQGGRDRVEIAA